MNSHIAMIIVGTFMAGLGLAMAVNGFETNLYSGDSEPTPALYVGLILAGVGGVFAQIGTIAAGVNLGVRSASESRSPEDVPS